MEDNEHSKSQAFSCCSVVFSVYVCFCAHVSVWIGKKIRQHVFVFVLHLCVLDGWECKREGPETA